MNLPMAQLSQHLQKMLIQYYHPASLAKMIMTSKIEDWTIKPQNVDK
jgi:hypothetical protein